jgi:secondary thiamine-phosphate synthase enzyme
MRFEFQVSSKSRAELVDITERVQDCVRQSRVQEGICVIVVPHTTAGLTVNENWDLSVKADLLATLERLVPWQANYHHMEGNAAAHIKTSLVGSSHMLLVQSGQLVLGTWQGVFLAEFDGPRQRQVLVRILRDAEGA